MMESMQLLRNRVQEITDAIPTFTTEAQVDQAIAELQDIKRKMQVHFDVAVEVELEKHFPQSQERR